MPKRTIQKAERLARRRIHPRQAKRHLPAAGATPALVSNSIELIAILDNTLAPPGRIARFWWSESVGLTCDNYELASRLTKEGIAIPPTGRMVYPQDGRSFFDALCYRFCGLLSAQPPLKVAKQGGSTVS